MKRVMGIPHLECQDLYHFQHHMQVQPEHTILLSYLVVHLNHIRSIVTEVLPRGTNPAAQKVINRIQALHSHKKSNDRVVPHVRTD